MFSAFTTAPQSSIALVSQAPNSAGVDVRTSTPAEFGGWLNKAIEEWGAVVKAENIQIDG